MGPGGFRPGFGRPGGGPGPGPEGDAAGVSLQFPLNAVSDLLPVYERLTRKTVVRDNAVLSGQQISLVTPGPVPAEEAIRLIEAALAVNGYVLIPGPDGRTVKLLLGRPANDPNARFNEGEPLYTSAEQLPEGEALVGYFMRLEHIAPEDAATIFANHVQLNPYGRITPVAAPAGLLITENAALVRKFAKLQEVIDVPAEEARLLTEFIQLEHADANTVSQIIQAAMDARYEESLRLEEQGRTVSGAPGTPAPRPEGSSPNRPDGQPNRDGGGGGSANQRNRPVSGVIGSANNPAAQLIADDRLNRIMVQAAPADLAFILGLVEQFDQPLPDKAPLEVALKYAKVIDVLPVVVDVLMDMGSGTTQLPGGRSLETRQTPVSSSTLSSLPGLQDDQPQTRFQQQTGDTTTGEEADRLAFPAEESGPVSVLVGKTRVIADRQSNFIIVTGSEEAKRTAAETISRLDRRPPQVYLGMVIGQLTLGNGIDLGVDYLKKFEAFDPSNANSSGIAAGLLAGRPDILTGSAIDDVRNNLITNAFGPASGLNVYGAIGDQIDVFITALETSNRFKVISRPVLSVQNNKRAAITSGQRIPVPSQTVTDVGGGVNNAALNTTITFEAVVLKLEVIPLINADREVTLEIVQVNDTVVGEQVVANNTVPIIGTEELTTTVTVPDRHTIVLGGLITEQQIRDVNGIPFVNRLPVVGQAFKRTNSEKTRSELLIFIQPVVVDGNTEIAAASFDEDVRTEVGGDAAKKFPGPGTPTATWTAEAEEPEKPSKSLLPTSGSGEGGKPSAKVRPERHRFPFGQRR
jgi:type II secretion system protein D